MDVQPRNCQTKDTCRTHGLTGRTALVPVGAVGCSHTLRVCQQRTWDVLCFPFRCMSFCLSAFGECHRIPATGTPHESLRSPSLPLHAIPPCKPPNDSLRHKNYAADCHPDMMPDHGRTSSRTPFETMPEDTDGHPRSDTRDDDLGAVGGYHERTRWHDD